MDVRVHNRKAWDKNVEDGNCWTVPIGADVVERAREGRFDLLLTPTKTVPPSWFPSLEGTPTLCLVGVEDDPISDYMDTFITTRAIKP